MSKYRGNKRKGERIHEAQALPWPGGRAAMSPDRYLAALAAAEAHAASPPGPAAEPAPAPPKANAPQRPPAPNADPSPAVAGSRTTGERGPLFEAMHAICPDCALEAKILWSDFRIASLQPRHGAKMASEALEQAFARMIVSERKRRSTPDHLSYFRAAFASIFHSDILDRVRNDQTKDHELVDADALNLLVACERAGIRFPDARGFRAFMDGVRERVGRAIPAAFLALLETHVPHVPSEARKSLHDADPLLLAVDLFAEGEGAVGLCRCLRLASALRRRRITRVECFLLWRTFGTARADDLVALLEDARVRPRAVERMLTRPGLVADTALKDLARLLAA